MEELLLQEKWMDGQGDSYISHHTLFAGVIINHAFEPLTVKSSFAGSFTSG